MTDTFDASPYADLLSRARAGFSTDSAYAVVIAEAASAMTTRQENRNNPEQLTEDVVRLFSQGAPVAEVSRVLRVHESRVRDILAQEGLDAAVRPSEAARSRSEARGGLPTPRPVSVRFVAPRKAPTGKPEKKRPEGIGKNRPVESQPKVVAEKIPKLKAPKPPAPKKPKKAPKAKKPSPFADNRCPADHRHGLSTTCYARHRCRCFPCVEAGRAAQRKN